MTSCKFADFSGLLPPLPSFELELDFCLTHTFFHCHKMITLPPTCMYDVIYEPLLTIKYFNYILLYSAEIQNTSTYFNFNGNDCT